MAYTITFAPNTQINISLQVGDLIYATLPTGVGGFAVSDTDSAAFQLLGPCSAIDGNIVTVDPVQPGSVLPNPASYIMFTKDNRANLSNEKGYYAEIEFRNDSREEAELFAVTLRVGESSK